MSDTINDIKVDGDIYVNINTLSGIVAGTALVITNKSTSRIALQISASQPAANSTDGEILYRGPSSLSVQIVTAGENTVWGKSLDEIDAPISVQDNT